jgi:hypothetical protein
MLKSLREDSGPNGNDIRQVMVNALGLGICRAKVPRPDSLVKPCRHISTDVPSMA